MKVFFQTPYDLNNVVLEKKLMLAQTKCIEKYLIVVNEIQEKQSYSQNLVMNKLSKITFIWHF